MPLIDWRRNFGQLPVKGYGWLFSRLSLAAEDL
jgi:hypothetical protein